jgi:TfoX/Sxy family transcriptional regulator of competence genes
MKWIEPSQQLVDTFEHLVPEAAGVEKRKMFGYPCSFVKGNMFMGLFQESMILRLSEKDREALLRLGQARQF